MFSLGIAAAGAAGGALLWPKGGAFWAAGATFAGLLMALGVFVSSGTAPCPSCGAKIAPLSFGSNRYVRCPACGGYCEGERGMLWTIEPDRVADRPEFAISLPDRLKLPGLCCVCGKEAVRTETITTRRARARGLRMPDISVEAPHCDFHQGGAALDTEASREFSVDAMKGSVTALRVRSYRFYRACRELNEE